MEITTGSLAVRDGAQLLASTLGDGDAGNVVITAQDVTFTGTSADGQFGSAAFSSAEPGATGQGGNVEITADRLTISSVGAGLNARSLGNGNAGDIILNLDSLAMRDGTIETIAAFSSGGQIIINADHVLLLGDSDIQTRVFSGSGDGGDITITGDFIFAFDDSDILTSAQGGSGGDITFNVRGFFGEGFILDSLTADPDTLEGNDRVDINAIGAVSGIVAIPDITFIQNSLSDLPGFAIPTDQILAGSCITRVDGDQGAFVVTGGGSLPSQPGSQNTSNYPIGEVQSLATSSAGAPWQPGDAIAEPTGVYELADGRLVLAQACGHPHEGF